MNVRLVSVMKVTQLLLLLSGMTDAKQDGPPVNVATLCSDMTPQHGGTPQTSTPPYTITTSVTCYKHGQAVTVTLEGTTANTTFRGFFLQARKPNDNTMSHGVFDVTGNSKAQTLNCFSQTNNAVGHNSGDDKPSSVFKWTPPSGFQDDLEFVATVVEIQSKYWVAAVKKTIQPCTTELTTASPTTGSNDAGLFTVNHYGLTLLLLLVLKLVISC